MQKIIIVMLLFTISIFGESIKKKEYLLEIQKDSRALLSKLPISYGKGMELSFVELESDIYISTIIVNKQILEKDSSITFNQSNIPILKDFIVRKYGSTIKNKLCNNSETRNVLESGIKYKFNYLFNSGENLGSILINKESCF